MPPPANRIPIALFSGSRGIIYAQILRLGVRLATAAILARLLTPADYGLQGMAAAVFGFLYIARDLGLVSTLQQARFSHQDLPAACRLGLGGGIMLTVAGVLLSWPTGRFFHETSTVPLVLAAMSLSFIFAGIAAPALGLLQREGRAAEVATAEAVAAAAAGVAAAGTAYLGAGVWSLVALTLVQEAAACLVAWRMTGATFSIIKKGGPRRTLATYGTTFASLQLINHAIQILDQVIVARIAGAVALGIYGRGAQLTALPHQYGIAPFHHWIVAQLGAPEASGALFRRALNSLLHVSLFSAALCVAVPGELLLLVFGGNWLEAAPVVRGLGIALAFQPWIAAPGWIFMARGALRPLILSGLAGAAITAAACLVAAPRGIGEVSQSIAVVSLIRAAAGPIICARDRIVRPEDWLAASLVPIAVHAGFAATLLFAKRALGGAGAGWNVAFTALVMIPAYYGLLLLVCPPFRREWKSHLFLTR